MFSSYRNYQLFTVTTLLIALWNSYLINHKFYSTIMYLCSNKVNATILINFFLMTISQLIQTLIAIFFGQIREIERLSIIERAKGKILDIVLLLVLFREEIQILFISNRYIYFILLIVELILLISFSILHWITIKRSEYLIAQGETSLFKHIKLICSYIILFPIDYNFCYHYYLKCLEDQDVDFQSILIGFEFLLLLLKLLLPFIKYLCNLLEIYQLIQLDSKLTLFATLDFFFKIAKLGIQLFLIKLIMQMHGLPIYLITDIIDNLYGIYQAFLTFSQSCYLVYMMNSIEDVSEDQIDQNDNICLICLHDINYGKKLSCQHIFHTHCLRLWIQGNPNQFCPKCRKPIAIKKEDENDKKNEEIEENQNQKKNEIKVTKAEMLQEVHYIQKKLQFYEHLQLVRNLTAVQDYTPKKIEIGSIAYGLPQKAVTYENVSTQIKKKQLQLMNTILVGLENQTLSDDFGESLLNELKQQSGE